MFNTIWSSWYAIHITNECDNMPWWCDLIIAIVPRETSEMFQIKIYEDKPNAFGVPIHSFISYERIGNLNEKEWIKSWKSIKLLWTV